MESIAAYGVILESSKRADDFFCLLDFDKKKTSSYQSLLLGDFVLQILFLLSLFG